MSQSHGVSPMKCGGSVRRPEASVLVLRVLAAMNNTEIAAVFREIADLLEKKKENWFKIRAYRKAADSIEGQPVAVAKLVAEGRLREIPGVGEAVARKITELVTTGELGFLERLREEAGEETK